jgi:hypothetical protein
MYIGIDSSNDKYRIHIKKMVDKITRELYTHHSSTYSNVINSTLSNRVIPKWEMLDYLGDNLFEGNTLAGIQSFCKSPNHADYYVFYMHPKGVTHLETDGSHDWRRYMNKFITGPYYTSCIKALQSNQFDVCGVEFTKSGVDPSGMMITFDNIKMIIKIFLYIFV